MYVNAFLTVRIWSSFLIFCRNINPSFVAISHHICETIYNKPRQKYEQDSVYVLLLATKKHYIKGSSMAF